ncbi:zinc ribbon domain-containing protein [Solirubrobacter sp. CPCC 204708]|uniref:Zinc ribbon domain-containing protein n=1 Tax=Solirubrobacter deserti TaxID=2282478 RepID=A0ABT4RGZ3_9ACTN|nr:zinc ribbon domain-containing protein [Solirubrobacter deserti]MBE2315400.1 zinc ribbon domain-containing protein [Solirubrobacter deserti]MDA0137758.1 zinc ribbon domain-containing protein [Solirubrobacter deserti]
MSFCPNCGAHVDAGASACPSCRARQEQFVVPAFIAAVIAGTTAAVVVLVAGLLIALVTPDSSIVGVAGVDASLLIETCRQAVGTLLAPMVEPGTFLLAGSRRIHPMVLLAIPLAALALATRWQLPRTAGAPAMARFGWALLIALPFSLLAFGFALIGGETESTQVSVSALSTLAVGVLWGLLGGAIGAASALPTRELITLSPVGARVLAAVRATLRPLAGVALVSTVLALAGWLVQIGANAGDVRSGRSTATALIEETVYAAEHGIHLTALSAGALFRPDAPATVGLPFPVEDPNALPGDFRIFSYQDALSDAVFLPALVVLLCVITLGALYGGFAAARAAGAERPATAAAWGALTGPVWALAMAVAVVLAGGLFHGDAADGSVFGLFLVGGALLGAAGGALERVRA